MMNTIIYLTISLGFMTLGLAEEVNMKQISKKLCGKSDWKAGLLKELDKCHQMNSMVMVRFVNIF